jgi:hypothetical protein
MQNLLGKSYEKILLSTSINFRGDYRITAYVQALLAEIEPLVLPRNNLETFQQRVLTRFAMVATAGVLACRFDILPFDEREIIDAVRYVASTWLGDESNLPERIHGILILREFIVKNEARMRAISDSDRIVKDLIGYWKYGDSGQKVYLLTPSGFDEALRGYDRRSVLQELRVKKLLICHEPNKFVTKHAVNGKRQGCYAIKDSILEFEGTHAPH